NEATPLSSQGPEALMARTPVIERIEGSKDRVTGAPSLNPDANSSRVPQGIAAAAVTNAGGVAIDAHDADHRADVRASLAGNDAEAVVLDLMQPLAAGGQLIGFGRGLDGLSVLVGASTLSRFCPAVLCGSWM